MQLQRTDCKMIARLLLVCFFVTECLAEAQQGSGSCQDIYVSNPSSPSRSYSIYNQKTGKSLDVFCDFYDGYGYTFFSKETTTEINIEDLYTDCSHVIVRQLRVDGAQQSVRLEQTSLLQNYSLSLQYSAHDGHFLPFYRRSQYLFVGFLPLNVANVKDYYTQGYRANGADYTFTSCDIDETTNYIALYFNSDGTDLQSWRDQRCYHQLPVDRNWIDSATRLSVERVMPQKYYFPFEFAFGGCGAWVSSNICNGPLLGISVGIRFDAHSSRGQSCPFNEPPSPTPPGTTIAASITSRGSCKEIYEADPLSITGTYTIQNQNGHRFRVFCDFYNGYGYTFLSRHTVLNLNINDLFTSSSEVIVRQTGPDDVQTSVKLQQLTAYRHIPLSVQFNSHYNFPETIYRQRNYIFVGFLPQSIMTNTYVKPGYLTNAGDHEYTRCRHNVSDNHISFYLSEDDAKVESWRDSYCFGRYPLDRPWIDDASVVADERKMPSEFYWPFEMTFGGCGAWVSSNVCGDPPVNAASVGLRFDASMPSSTTSTGGPRTTASKVTTSAGQATLQKMPSGDVSKFTILVVSCVCICLLLVLVLVTAIIIIFLRHRSRRTKARHAHSRNARLFAADNNIQHMGINPSYPPAYNDPPPMYTPHDMIQEQVSKQAPETKKHPRY